MDILELTGYPEELAASSLPLLREYCRILCEVNERVRLVGPRDTETLWEEHIMDCIHLLPLLPPKGSVVDVGTGGGLPGAVLAICRPDLHFTLVDSLSRKTTALQEIVSHLDLRNISVVCLRSEDLALQRREGFDCAAVRAVSEAGIIAEYLSPLVAPSGTLLAMKGPAWEEEIQDITGRWHELGLSEPCIYSYPMAGHRRFIARWDKIAPCPVQYPRRPGRAEKKLWWR